MIGFAERKPTAKRALLSSLESARLVRRRPEDNARVRFLSEVEGARLRAAIREHWPERELEFDITLNTGLRPGGCTSWHGPR